MGVPEKISIENLSKFDKDFLERNLCFCTKDSLGRDRNKGQLKIGRQSKGTSPFEVALTGITHEIMRRCLSLGIDVTPTYHINKFVLFKESDKNMVELMTTIIIAQFISGEKFNVQMKDNEFNHYSKVSQKAYVETVNNVIQNGTADDLADFLNL